MNSDSVTVISEISTVACSQMTALEPVINSILMKISIGLCYLQMTECLTLLFLIGVRPVKKEKDIRS